MKVKLVKTRTLLERHPEYVKRIEGCINFEEPLEQERLEGTELLFVVHGLMGDDYPEDQVRKLSNGTVVWLDSTDGYDLIVEAESTKQYLLDALENSWEGEYIEL